MFKLPVYMLHKLTITLFNYLHVCKPVTDHLQECPTFSDQLEDELSPTLILGRQLLHTIGLVSHTRSIFVAHTNNLLLTEQ